MATQDGQENGLSRERVFSLKLVVLGEWEREDEEDEVSVRLLLLPPQVRCLWVSPVCC